MNKRMREVGFDEQKRWNSLSEAAKDYERMTKNHPEWQVKSNILLEMTGSIVEESQSRDVAFFQAAVIGALTASAMSSKPGIKPNVSVPVASGLGRVSQILRNLGATDDDLAAFARGEKVWVWRTEGGIKTTCYFQLQGGKLIAGVLSIKNPNPASPSVATVRALKSFLDNSTDLARTVNAKTLRLEGNAVTNLGPKGVEGLLDRMGFRVDPQDPGLMVRETEVR